MFQQIHGFTGFFGRCASRGNLYVACNFLNLLACGHFDQHSGWLEALGLLVDAAEDNGGEDDDDGDDDGDTSALAACLAGPVLELQYAPLPRACPCKIQHILCTCVHRAGKRSLARSPRDETTLETAFLPLLWCQQCFGVERLHLRRRRPARLRLHLGLGSGLARRLGRHLLLCRGRRRFVWSTLTRRLGEVERTSVAFVSGTLVPLAPRVFLHLEVTCAERTRRVAPR